VPSLLLVGNSEAASLGITGLSEYRLNRIIDRVFIPLESLYEWRFSRVSLITTTEGLGDLLLKHYKSK
jgi:hypothetical protein